MTQGARSTGAPTGSAPREAAELRPVTALRGVGDSLAARLAKLGITTLEGYIAGRVAVEAARAAAARNERPGRDSFRTALATLQADFGGYRVNFGAQQGHGSQYVDMVVINRHGHIVG